MIPLLTNLSIGAPGDECAYAQPDEPPSETAYRTLSIQETPEEKIARLKNTLNACQTIDDMKKWITDNVILLTHPMSRCTVTRDGVVYRSNLSQHLLEEGRTGKRKLPDTKPAPDA